MSSSAPPDLPTFPPAPTAPSTTSLVQQPLTTPVTTNQQQTPLLYNTQPAPDYILRPFEQRHDRQTIYLDARKAGAVDALIELVAKGNKTNLVEEMVNDILEKYAQLLQDNAELVQIVEEKYRKKHNL